MKTFVFDRSITVEQNTATQGTDGSILNSWATVLTTWAEKRDMTGREKFLAGAAHSEDIATFTIRYPGNVAIDPAMRIRYSGSVYRITSISELGRRQYLQFLTMHVYGGGD